MKTYKQKTTKILIKSTHSCLLFHRWKAIQVKDGYLYQQCRDCASRRVSLIAHDVSQVPDFVDYDWLNIS